MLFLPKNLLKKSFQIVKKIMVMHLKKMALKKMLSRIKIINDINAPGPLTRSKASHLSNFCGHFAFVSITEPTKVDEAFLEPEWIQAMQEELHQFELNNVWELANVQILANTISSAQNGSTATSKMKMALW